MEKVTIFGASDDLIEIDGILGADEFSKPRGAWTGILEAPNGETALVYVDYRRGGTWTVALGQYEEDYALPEWPQHYETDFDLSTYSVKATIEVPDGTTIREYEG